VGMTGLTAEQTVTVETISEVTQVSWTMVETVTLSEQVVDEDSEQVDTSLKDVMLVVKSTVEVTLWTMVLVRTSKEVDGMTSSLWPVEVETIVSVDTIGMVATMMVLPVIVIVDSEEYEVVNVETEVTADASHIVDGVVVMGSTVLHSDEVV
jgi:hypothetical protein